MVRQVVNQKVNPFDPVFETSKKFPPKSIEMDEMKSGQIGKVAKAAIQEVKKPTEGAICRFKAAVIATLSTFLTKVQNLVNWILFGSSDEEEPLNEKTLAEMRENLTSSIDGVAVQAPPVQNKDLQNLTMTPSPDLKVDLMAPIGQKNLGWYSCYMNASLQSLEAAFIGDSKLLSLLEQDLSLMEGETVLELEKRLLKDWAPITESKYMSNPTEKELNALGKIHFKWSYLKLLQAKLYRDEEAMNKLLRLHFDTFFAWQLHTEFKNGYTDQKDAASYLEMWSEVLDKGYPMSIAQQFEHLGASYTSSPPKVPTAPIQIELIGENSGSADLLKLISMSFDRANHPGEHYTAEGIGKIEKYTHITRFECDPPEVIQFHLKRFQKNAELTVKIDKDINIHPEVSLDLSPYFGPEYLKEGAKAEYDLCSFTVHRGLSLAWGHYVAYVLKGDQWYECNDDAVSKVSLAQVPFKQAYTLCYRLRAPQEKA